MFIVVMCRLGCQSKNEKISQNATDKINKIQEKEDEKLATKSKIQ